MTTENGGVGGLSGLAGLKVTQNNDDESLGH